MNLGLTRLLTDCFVDRGKAVARMALVGFLDASGAVVPVGAGQALVAGTNNALEEISMSSNGISKHGFGEGYVTFSQPSQIAACLN